MLKALRDPTDELARQWWDAELAGNKVERDRLYDETIRAGIAHTKRMDRVRRVLVALGYAYIGITTAASIALVVLLMR